MPKKHNTFEIIIECPKEDILKAWSYYETIKKRAKEGKSVPPNVMKRFLAFFDIKKGRLEQDFKEKLKTVKEETKVRFLKDREFKSLSSEAGLKNKPRNVKNYDALKKLIEHLFSSFINHYSFLENTKDKIVLFIYQDIQFYLQLHNLDDKEINGKKLFGHYQSTVIAGFIALRLGYDFSKDLSKYNSAGNFPTNKEIYGVTKYYTKELREKLK